MPGVDRDHGHGQVNDLALIEGPASQLVDVVWYMAIRSDLPVLNSGLHGASLPVRTHSVPPSRRHPPQPRAYTLALDESRDNRKNRAAARSKTTQSVAAKRPRLGTPGRMQSRVGGGTSSGFGTGEAEANRPPHKARDVVDLEPSHELGPMSVHGLHAEVETSGDLFRSAPFGDELHDLALPRREAARFPGHLRPAGARRRGVRLPGRPSPPPRPSLPPARRVAPGDRRGTTRGRPQGAPGSRSTRTTRVSGTHREPGLDNGPRAQPRLDVELAPDVLRPLTHAEQAEAPLDRCRSREGGSIEPNAVVAGQKFE